MSEADILEELKKITQLLQELLNRIPYTVAAPVPYTPPSTEYCMCIQPEPMSSGYCAKCGKRLQYNDIIYFSTT
jgi:hypothetical protein